MSTGAEHQGHDPAAQAGRHRLNTGGEAWTPPVPPRALRPVTAAGHRHRLAGQPMDPPSAGSLPLAPPRPVPPRQVWPPRSPQPSFPQPPRPQPQPPLPQPRSVNRVPDQAPRPPAASGFEPAQGHLPLPQPIMPRTPEPPVRIQGSLPLPAPELEPDFEPVAELPAEEPTVRRTKVTFTTKAPPRPTVPEEDDDVRVYVAAPMDGLGTFDLGSVPASVTPPKTWRKAAWFATGSSAAVVVGLLFAGSLLVGKPEETSSQGGWPGYRGGSPLISDEQQVGQPTAPHGGSAGKPAKGSSENSSTADDRSSAQDSAPGTTPGRSSTGGPVTTGTGTPDAPASGPPRKPPPTAAMRTTDPAPVWYHDPHDTKAMGDVTEKFLNSVTTDPVAASAVTTGELHEQGPEALKERYADVAYFEVKKVAIDQERGVTVNTVEVTRKDGTKTIEYKTLTFGDDEKIESDGQ